MQVSSFVLTSIGHILVTLVVAIIQTIYCLDQIPGGDGDHPVIIPASYCWDLYFFGLVLSVMYPVVVAANGVALQCNNISFD